MCGRESRCTSPRNIPEQDLAMFSPRGGYIAVACNNQSGNLDLRQGIGEVDVPDGRAASRVAIWICAEKYASNRSCAGAACGIGVRQGNGVRQKESLDCAVNDRPNAVLENCLAAGLQKMRGKS